MKTLKFSFLFSLLMSGFFGFSQTIKLQGVVKDAKEEVLEMANVIAINQDAGTLASFATTDKDGVYELALKKNQTYLIRVSYIGFETIKQEITTTETQLIKKDFVLQEKDNQLAGVELTYEMPVTIKGDTIIYTTDAFTTGKEKKLGEVLEKLPGVEINDDGEVEVEGKKVSKIMVEGKDFFDGDSKLAIKNIPADAVKKVEVLKNYSDVSQMRGLENDDDTIALNIRLKEGKEHFWFGEIAVGGGLNSRYLAHPKLFYYSPNKSLNILTDLNNIGEVPFTMRDYFKFSGGFKNIMKKGRSAMRVSSEQIGYSFLKNDKAKAVESKFAALNFNYTIKKDLDFSGFAIYNENNTEMLTNSNQYYISTEITDIKTISSLQKNKLGMLKLSANYKPKLNFQLDYDAIIKKSQQSENLNTTSSITALIDSKRQQEPFSINQNISIYYTLNEQHIFSSAVQMLYDQNTPVFNAISDHEFFKMSDILELQTSELYDITQNKTQQSQKYDAKIDYFYILNNTSNLNFTLGNSFSKQNLDSFIFQIIGQTLHNFSDKTLNNQAIFTFNDVFLAFNYNMKYGKLTLTPGLSIHNYYKDDLQLGLSKKQNLQRILPSFFAKYRFKNTRSLQFDYGIITDFSDVNKYAIGYVLSDYNTLLVGNRNIESSLNHSYSLRYRDFNMFNFTSIFASLIYNKRVNVVKTLSNHASINRVSEYINITNPDESLSGRLRYGKRFSKFKIVATTNISYKESYSIDMRGIEASKSINQNYKVALSSRFKSAPNFELGYKIAISDYKSATRTTRYITDKPFVSLEASFLKDFVWTVDYQYQNYRNTDATMTNKYAFLSSKLYYQKKGSSWEFVLSGNNLLQTESMDSNSASDFLITTSRYFVQPNYYMLTLKYNL